MLQINESTCKRADGITWRNNTVAVYFTEITWSRLLTTFCLITTQQINNVGCPQGL